MMVYLIPCLVLMLHLSAASESEYFSQNEEVSKRSTETCNSVCARYPYFCHGRGLCVDGNTTWTVQCLCDGHYWGRRCQFNSECEHYDNEECFFKKIIGKHSLFNNKIWFPDNTKQGAVITMESKNVAIKDNYRLVLSYSMSVWETDYKTRHPVFKSPREFDAIEIKTRLCGNVGQTPPCWGDNSGPHCSAPPDSRPCVWASHLVYAYHVTDAYTDDWQRTTCIDVSPKCQHRHYFQFGLKAKCNNRNGCNSRWNNSWTKGTTLYHFSVKVEPGTCQDREGNH
ncbi:uncharacterized protein LOC128181874 [Crassostrea angulata]|uniref:uncharacterized protein LOC128181874 n=1 Tax=Magallana angulata TaxID=2784310 RepID=UPI0022B1187A|nr:uncharacterized protein LOC128181874 [Crassostrea angulata]